MAVGAFTDMSTTGLILITVTLGHCRSVGRSASTTSRQTRREMGEATSVTLAMKGRLSTRSPDIGEVAMLLAMATATTRAPSGLNDSG
jgi:hypothetical protein